MTKSVHATKKGPGRRHVQGARRGQRLQRAGLAEAFTAIAANSEAAKREQLRAAADMMSVVGL